jgi:hypothetical protein
MVWFGGLLDRDPIAINIIGIIVDKPNDVNAWQLHFTYSNHWKILHYLAERQPIKPWHVNFKYTTIYIYGVKRVDLFVKMKMHLR